MRKRKETEKEIEKRIMIQRNYLVFVAYHYLNMPMKEVKEIFGLSRQSVFRIIKESEELA